MERGVFITPLLIITIMLFSVSAGYTKSPTEKYIETYKDIAIEEMKRSGIPASIKLAQGILESGNGQSQLARKGNNHFGIKCPGGWEGRTMLYDDDAPDECFRVYPNAKASYRDHTEFLMRGWRYRNLFELEPTDYKGWAHGLSEAGYATNPMYPQLLIGIIERHELYIYDRGIRSRDAIASKEAIEPDERIFEYNGIKAVVVQEGETYEDITEKFFYFRYQLARYNDIERGADLEAGEIVYLKPKKRWPSERRHTVQTGETLHDISQIYGVRISRLYRRNRLDSELEEEPAVGEVIYLRGRRSEPPKLRTGEPEPKTRPEPREVIVSDSPESERKSSADKQTENATEVTPSGNTETRPREHVHVVKAGETIADIADRYGVEASDIKRWNGLSSGGSLNSGRLIALFLPVEEASAGGMENSYHIVEPGETLYSISRKYNVPVDKIRELNDLDNDNITINSRLRVK